MQIDFYGLSINSPRATLYLYSPWRASALEHRIFELIRNVNGLKIEHDFDEFRVHITDAKHYKQAINLIVRVLKGWQEEASDGGRERRFWRWLLEADTDEHGFDQNGEPASLWAFLQIAIERGSPDEGDKNEIIDLNGIGLRIWPENS